MPSPRPPQGRHQGQVGLCVRHVLQQQRTTHTHSTSYRHGTLIYNILTEGLVKVLRV
jgi:hypothetical protein